MLNIPSYYRASIGLLKKHWEFCLALCFFLLIVISIWVEFTFFKLNLYSFLVVVNLNLLLLFITFFIVMRKLLRLFFERRRKILGSHLRTRLVTAFVITSLIPAVFIFFIFTKIVSTSVNYWFSSQVENTLEKASVLGDTFFSSVTADLQQQVERFTQIRAKRSIEWNSNAMLNTLQRANLSTTFVTLLDANNVSMLHLTSENEALVTAILNARKTEQGTLNLQGSFLLDMNGNDYVVLLHPITYTPTAYNASAMGPIVPDKEGKNGVLCLAVKVGTGFTKAQNDIANGVIEYKKLHKFRDPIKFSFFYLLGILTLLIIFGSVWYGLRISKELIAPIVNLAEAFSSISSGNLNVRLQEELVTEEMEMLFTSFNQMAKQLVLSRAKIMDANENLERTNTEVEAQKAHIETIMENITTGVVSLDAQGYIKSLNKSVLELFSIEKQFVLGKKLENVIPSTLVPLLLEMMLAIEEQRTPWQKQVVLNIRGIEKKLLIVVLSLPISSMYGGTIIVFDDITELDKSYRIEAWREVASRIAHEIKNPLTPIKLSAQRLMKRYNYIDDEVFLQCTRQIIQQVEQLQQFVGEFSRFARLPEIVRSLGTIVQVLEENIIFFRTTYPHITFEFLCKNDIPMLSIDVSAMQRVFMNLFTNAIDALDGTTNPTIVTEVSYNATLHSVTIVIRDNGHGIPEHEQSRLFEPYFSNKKEGTGLGLAIVQSIITDHRGYIRVRSSEAGTAMTITLPVE